MHIRGSVNLISLPNFSDELFSCDKKKKRKKERKKTTTTTTTNSGNMKMEKGCSRGISVSTKIMY